MVYERKALGASRFENKSRKMYITSSQQVDRHGAQMPRVDFSILPSGAVQIFSHCRRKSRSNDLYPQREPISCGDVVREHIVQADADTAEVEDPADPHPRVAARHLVYALSFRVAVAQPDCRRKHHQIGNHEDHKAEGKNVPENGVCLFAPQQEIQDQEHGGKDSHHDIEISRGAVSAPCAEKTVPFVQLCRDQAFICPQSPGDHVGNQGQAGHDHQDSQDRFLAGAEHGAQLFQRIVKSVHGIDSFCRKRRQHAEGADHVQDGDRNAGHSFCGWFMRR